MKLVMATALVWAIVFVVPIGVYGAFSAFTGLAVPGGSPLAFLGGVAVSKLGTALGFVLIFALAREQLGGQWLLYCALWWLMFALGEVGQAIGPDYSWQEAIAGLISEAIYFPLSGLVVIWLIRP